MAGAKRLICRSDELLDGGRGVRFGVEFGGRERSAFAIRYDGGVYAYFNECGHVPAELDWQPGEFFDSAKLYLICSIHGALYSPRDGRCLGGRCQGRGLQPLVVFEEAGAVWLDLDRLLVGVARGGLPVFSKMEINNEK
ncbi:Rieske 2Fe-2S domain-containing protein [Dechloromonas sp. ZY10]|uniref:Rieske (2Fe-2S) protein n=1 Tax=Dechloromonas aquae TaxID=2664436 RepID=UPI003526D230